MSFPPRFRRKNNRPLSLRLPKLHRNSSLATDGRRASTAKNSGYRRGGGQVKLGCGQGRQLCPLRDSGSGCGRGATIRSVILKFAIGGLKWLMNEWRYAAASAGRCQIPEIGRTSCTER